MLVRSGILCPKCRSERIERIHRSFVEKLVTSKLKYSCKRCKAHFFEKMHEKRRFIMF